MEPQKNLHRKENISLNVLVISERKTQKNLKQMVKIIEQDKEIKKRVMKVNVENEKNSSNNKAEVATDMEKTE